MINNFKLYIKQVLIGHGRVDVNALNKIGMTPLMYASAEDKVNIFWDLTPRV